MENSANSPKVRGLRLGAAGAGIKRTDRDDILLIELAEGSSCAAVFTRNAFCAAPVTVARAHLGQSPRWLLVNSGNANAGTGARGLEDARRSCRVVAELTAGRPEQVLPFSTGVIGEYLPLEKIEAALPRAVESLDEEAWERAAKAIMTTDTRPKLVSRKIALRGGEVSLVGIAKGAGMIQPNMATLLAYIGTDAAVEQPLLQTLLAEAADRSFNCITVDGDTSTNDSCVLMATGRSGVVIGKDGPNYPLFAQALQAVCDELAEAIVRDGEGATKFMTLVVEQARTEAEAREVAKTIAHSPLVKTAFFASDPNWGRILAAVGRSGCPELDIGKVAIWLGDVCIVENGGRASGYTEEAGQKVMAETDITVRVVLGRGDASQRVLTCDFSYDYVKINAEYRT
ncbi:MAG: bifunctional glutamate N-acetyltransferase/amino-acid acetyltransferase ArgJ [Methylococcaceae bacterium]|nr:bifunctional glutamate N-acetyltransferase/amino-acid acetyltransferase ArgJ [Methylococcaceae bacterium]